MYIQILPSELITSPRPRRYNYHPDRAQERTRTSILPFIQHACLLTDSNREPGAPERLPIAPLEHYSRENHPVKNPKPILRIAALHCLSGMTSWWSDHLEFFIQHLFPNRSRAITVLMSLLLWIVRIRTARNQPALYKPLAA